METFVDIPSFEGKYKISNMGNILNIKRNKLLSINGKNYIKVNLFKNGVRKSFSIHRLVATCFIENPENKKDVNHINGIKSDNRVENLEWCTRSENLLHSYRVLGRKKCNFRDNHPNKGKMGGNNHLSKKIIQMSKNKIIIKIWTSMVDIEKELGISQSSISMCCNGRSKSAGGYIWNFLK